MDTGDKFSPLPYQEVKMSVFKELLHPGQIDFFLPVIPFLLYKLIIYAYACTSVLPHLFSSGNGSLNLIFIFYPFFL